MTNQNNEIKFSIEARRLKDFLNTVYSIQENARLIIEDEHWKTVESDPANVVAIHSTIDKITFDVYDIPDEIIEIEAGMDIHKLVDILKLADKDDYILLTFFYEEKEDNFSINKMELQFTDLQFSLRTIDLGILQKQFEPPALDPVASVVLDKKEFNTALNAPYKIGAKYINFTLTDEGLLFKSTADFDSSSLEYKLNKDMLISYGKKSDDEEITSLYSLEFLEKIKKPFMSSSSDEIKLEWGKDYPLKATFDYAGEYGEAVYYLALRIENYGE